MGRQKGIIFFDIGDTLLNFYENQFLEGVAEYLGATAEELDDFLHMGNPPLLYLFNLGMGEKDIYHSFLPLARNRTRFEGFKECVKLWLSLSFEENEPQYFRRLMELLGERYHLGIISNVDRISAAVCREREFYFWDYIPEDLRFYSYELGYCKGREPYAYHAVFRKCRLEPRYLIDNLAENIEGFERAGGKGFFFRNTAALHKELAGQGLLTGEWSGSIEDEMGKGLGDLILAPSSQAKSLARRFGKL